jgi:hypothetical protein
MATPPPGAAEQISAADYDPSLDRREDEGKRLGAIEITEVEAEDDEEMDDMFAIGTPEKKKKSKKINEVSNCLLQERPTLNGLTAQESGASPIS